MQLFCQPKIPIGKIDQHSHIGPLPVYLCQQFVKLAIELRQVAQHFKKSDHGHIPRVNH